MFDWLYERAGELKKYSFVSGGVCVAVNTVIGCVPKTATKTTWLDSQFIFSSIKW